MGQTQYGHFMTGTAARGKTPIPKAALFRHAGGSTSDSIHRQMQPGGKRLHPALLTTIDEQGNANRLGGFPNGVA
jgi:hypothetical protein